MDTDDKEEGGAKAKPTYRRLGRAFSDATQDAQAKNVPAAVGTEAVADASLSAETTTPSTKAPKRPRKASTTKPSRTARGGTVDAKKFKEDMIEYRLDHWRARAKVVYTNNQQDATSLWSPQWANFVTQERGMSLFDGFDRIWFIPFDVETPLPTEKQHVADDLSQRARDMKVIYQAKGEVLYPRLLHHIEEEVQKTCQDQWDENLHKPTEAPMQWAQAKHKYGLTQKVDMAARARLIDGRATLPGYYSVSILDLAANGKIVTRRVTMPSDIDMAGFLRRLDTWCPPDDAESQNLLEIVRKKLEIISQHGTPAGKEEAQGLLTQLGKPLYKVGVPGSERSFWIFRLLHTTRYTVPAGKAPGEVKTWKKLKESTFDELLDGVRAGKHPAVVRVDELGELLPSTHGEPELSSDQLGIVDAMLARQSEQERERGRQWMKVVGKLKGPVRHLKFAGPENMEVPPGAEEENVSADHEVD
ncbi:hypothetical protein FZEAL_3206 [Fusarium zealandicum]|uniref:Uncharacterized protein n=1 Tax=Fusarium zealandicum TaxID=1053134 RepID=A0A8H4XN54_9HYPO|nr:hypothetical protein FZEAL_3206 [Fusarium zealandicum]